MVVGLGNPGHRYETTRHNAGFIALDLLADELAVEVGRRQGDSLIGTGRVGGERVLLVKPLTFMNLSGRAVGPLARWYGIRPEDILVLMDDLDLEPGRLRVRAKGGSGGHRGLQSVLASLGTDLVPRIRIGIGRPPAGRDPADYVLEPFTEEEWALVRPALLKAATAGRLWLEGLDLEEVMNRFNC